MFSVTSHRFSLMAPRALAATREDAVACGMGLGIAPEDMHIEPVSIEDLRRAVRAMCGGGSERPVHEPRPMLRQPDDAAPTSLDSNIEAA